MHLHPQEKYRMDEAQVYPMVCRDANIPQIPNQSRQGSQEIMPPPSHPITASHDVGS